MAKNRSFLWQPASLSSCNLTGLKVVVVGGTGGIGRALSRSLVRCGASVTVVGRTFRDQEVAGIEFVRADLSLMSEAKRVTDVLNAETVDLMIFTTGIMAGPKREQTSEGIERDLAVSYLSRLVILRAIASRLGRDRRTSSNAPRVFIMGFPGFGPKIQVDDLNSESRYSKWKAHGYTIAGNEVLVLDAARRYPNVSVFGLNPGFIDTNIRSNLFGTNAVLLNLFELLLRPLTISPETYAERMIPLLVSPDLEGQSGLMFNNKAAAIPPSKHSAEPSYAATLITASETLVTQKTGIEFAERTEP